MLVTLPEETPVNELVDTAFSLEDRVGVSLGPVVVNGLYPDRPGHRHRPGRRPPRRPARRSAPARPTRWPAAAAFRLHRTDLQAEQLGRLAERLPLPQLRLPYLFQADLGLAELDELADRAARRDRARSRTCEPRTAASDR